METNIRWAVVGTGAIAETFVNGSHHAVGAEVTAICSRNEDRARIFAERHAITHFYTGLDDLLAASDIDAVYLATPNSAHFEAARKIIQAGKPLLIEKSMTTTVADAEELARLAKEQGTFLMEGLWTRYLPALNRAKAAIEEGRIGEITGFKAELAFFKQFDPKSRFFSKDLGGGSLLDLGIYTLSIAEFFLGEADTVSGTWQSAPTGVDLRADLTFGKGTVKAQLSCGFDRDGSNLCVVAGTKCSIVIAPPFIAAKGFFIATNTMSRSLLTAENGLFRKAAARVPLLPGARWRGCPLKGTGLEWEISAASAAIKNGLLQEPAMPVDATIRALKQIEQVLASPAAPNGPG